MKTNGLHIITRGQYGCSKGEFVCVLSDVKEFKKLMNKKQYVLDSLKFRFHNDNTRIWYRVQEIDLLDSSAIIDYFNEKFEDISNSENYKRVSLGNSKVSMKYYRKTGIKPINSYC